MAPEVRKVSIHASPQRQGERHKSNQGYESGRSFNPRLTSAARRTTGDTHRLSLTRTFQSTPHLSGKANRFRQARHIAENLFQSTPHLSGKANSFSLVTSRMNQTFQSTPHLSGKANKIYL